MWLALAATASGAAWWFGTGLHPIAWLTWLAPLPLLLLAPRLPWGYVLLGGICAGACAGLNLWHYLRHVIGLPLPVVLIVAVAPATTFALALLLLRHAWPSRKYVSAAIAFPALWVAVDYLVVRVSPHGTFGSLAYSRLDVLPFIQVVALAGIWDAAFLLLPAPAALAALLIPGPIEPGEPGSRRPASCCWRSCSDSDMPACKLLRRAAGASALPRSRGHRSYRSARRRRKP